MILYFSGTGNSGFVAHSLGNLLGEEVKYIPAISPDSIELRGDRLIFIFPVYSWGVPPFIINYIDRLSASEISKLRDGRVKLLAVMTCGDETGLAHRMFADLWSAKGVAVRGIWSVIMPNDYVLFPGFGIDSPLIERRKQNDSISRIRGIASSIESGDYKIDVHKGSWAGFKSKVIYPLWRRWGMNCSKWHSMHTCIGCGKCAQICPSGNIKMSEENPVWGNRCLSCTACYHHCPVNAVQYGRITKGKGQYYCKAVPMEK